MTSFIVSVLIALMLLSTTNVDGINLNISDSSAFEVILSKIHEKMIQMESSMQEVNQKLSSDINQLHRSLTSLQTQLGTAVQQDNVKNEKLEKGFETLLFRSSFVLVQPTVTSLLFKGYTERTTFGDGWLVFQHRKYGSVSFFRDWADYRQGFGNINGEFWLGLELLHRLTSSRPHELLVEMKGYDGRYEYARYSEFRIGSEAEQYSLEELGTYSGTAGDGLSVHKYEKFSTRDRDNDRAFDRNCAADHMGAWWYYDCGYSSLNGRYINDETGESMYWGNSSDHLPSKSFSRMLIREI